MHPAETQARKGPDTCVTRLRHPRTPSFAFFLVRFDFLFVSRTGRPRFSPSPRRRWSEPRGTLLLSPLCPAPFVLPSCWFAFVRVFPSPAGLFISPLGRSFRRCRRRHRGCFPIRVDLSAYCVPSISGSGRVVGFFAAVQVGDSASSSLCGPVLKLTPD
jgi:hypothetical protein